MTTKYSQVSNTYNGKFPQQHIKFNMGVSKVPATVEKNYNSLTHNNAGNGSGYFQVKNAYSQNCTKHVDRSCNEKYEKYENTRCNQILQKFEEAEQKGKMTPAHFKSINQRIQNACTSNRESDIMFINSLTETKLFFADINSKNKIDKKMIENQKTISVLIGPEGDFSPNERELIIMKNNVIPFSLSKNILRTDTATISSLTIISYFLNL